MSAALHHFADYLASQSWQLALGFALVAGLCRALRNASAHWRYLLWIALLLKCVLPAAILVPLPDWHPQERVPMASHEVASTRSTQPPAAAVQPFVSNSRQQESLSVWQRLDIRDCLLTVWGAGAIILLAVATAKALRIQRDLKRERTLPDMELECEFLDLMNALALRSRPKLCLIRGLSQPFVWGVFHGVQCFVPRMLASGEPGHIVNTSSTDGGIAPLPTASVYAVTKALTCCAGTRSSTFCRSWSRPCSGFTPWFGG